MRSVSNIFEGTIFEGPAFTRFFTALAVVGVSALLLASAGRAQRAESPPNILLLLADDMTYDDLGSYGNADVRTPNLDRLAAQGLRFRYAFNSSPMCAPTRMSLYTGIHPVRNGAYPNHSRVYEHIRSMPHYLDSLGYRVALIGKRHEAPAENFPFEYLGGRHHDGGKGVALDVSKVRAFMEENKDRPWSLVVASNQPHRPWNRGVSYAYNPDSLSLPPYLVDTEVTREALARYYAEVTYMDEQAGRILQDLRETGQAEETIVIFLSEHGSNFPHAKWTAYDTGLRSAAIVRWPNVVRPGRLSEAMIQYVDLLPTLIEAAGGAPGQYNFDGRSFLPVLRGERDEHRQYAFGIQTSTGIYSGPEAYGIRTVRSKRYRLIWNVNWKNTFQNMVTEGSGIFQSWKKKAEAGDPFARKRVRWYQERPQYELYDLRHDPYELENVADDPAYQAVERRLKRQLEEWMQQQGDEGAATERAAPQRLSDRWRN